MTWNIWLDDVCRGTPRTKQFNDRVCKVKPWAGPFIAVPLQHFPLTALHCVFTLGEVHPARAGLPWHGAPRLRRGGGGSASGGLSSSGSSSWRNVCELKGLGVSRLWHTHGNNASYLFRVLMASGRRRVWTTSKWMNAGVGIHRLYFWDQYVKWLSSSLSLVECYLGQKNTVWTQLWLVLWNNDNYALQSLWEHENQFER